MTPKEKAEELVNKFMSIKNIKLSDYSYIELPTGKHCALIVVDEILSANHIWYKGTIPYNYWIEVKQEIEAL